MKLIVCLSMFSGLVAAAPRVFEQGGAPASRPARDQGVLLVGAFEKQGLFPVTEGMTLLDVAADAPLLPDADARRVLLIRPDAANPLLFEVDLRDMWLTGKTTWNFMLRPGDIIVIPKAQGPNAAVLKELDKASEAIEAAREAIVRPKR